MTTRSRGCNEWLLLPIRGLRPRTPYTLARALPLARILLRGIRFPSAGGSVAGDIVQVVTLRGYVELLRPANVITALTDVLAGFAIAGLASPKALPWLLLATACLYAGGVVLNDVFDRRIDANERPERPIPSGRVPVRHAALLGGGLLVVGT